MTMLKHIYNDGGRAIAGYTGTAGDCVARSIAIVSGLPYGEVWKALAEGNASERPSKHNAHRGTYTADHGINTRAKWFSAYMESIGFVWVSGAVNGVHIRLRAEDLPASPIVCAVSNHYVAVRDGAIEDNGDCSGGGRRYVYGYWTKPATLYNVFKEGRKLNMYPLNAKAAETMRALFKLNYGGDPVVKPA